MKLLATALLILGAIYVLTIDAPRMAVQLRTLADERAAARIAAAEADKAEAQARAAEAQADTEIAQARAVAENAPIREHVLTLSVIVGLAVLGVAAAGLTAAAIEAAYLRARLIAPGRDGLYPALVSDRPVVNLNEPGAQIARIAPGQMRYAVLPASQPVDELPAVPAPALIEAGRLAHIERLLLAAAPGGDYDGPES